MAHAATKRKKHAAHEEEHENHERWLITYADMITLLMVLFIVLYSISQVDLAKFRKLKEGIKGGFGGASASGLLDGGQDPVEGGTGPFDLGLDGIPSAEALRQAGQALSEREARIRAERRENTKLEGVERQIEKALEADGLGQSVRFRLEARGLVVTILTDRVLFDLGEADLRPEGREIMDHLAPALVNLPNRLSVEGHTDNLPITGRYPSNWELSTARASTVLRELTEHHGIPLSRLQAAGYADQRPLAGNGTVDGRAVNRRVEIVVLSTQKDHE